MTLVPTFVVQRRFDDRIDRHLDPCSAQALPQQGAHRLHLGVHHVGLDTEQQPAVHPHLLDVVDLHTALGERAEEPLRNARGVLPAHRDEER